MNLNEYLKFAKSTAVYSKIIVLKNPTQDQIQRCQAVDVELSDITWIYPLIGLFGEAGELANNLKKVIRDNNFVITPEIKDKLEDEKGDVSWYDVILDSELKIDPDHKLDNNVIKLLKRKANNTVHDNGGPR